MKCIHCGRISRLRERTGGRCPGCRHRFAFDPQARPASATDAEFQDAIDRVSGGGQLRFTARQLWLAASMPLAMPAPPRPSEWVVVRFALGLALPPVAMALLAGVPGMLMMAVVTGAAGAAIGRGVVQTGMERYADRIRPRLPFDVFLRSHLPRWVEVHGDVPGLLPPRDTDAAAPRQVPADAAALDRAVVTDRWAMARMLVANGFHLQHKCAVLSRDGYPNGMAGTMREALRRNPRLTVFALHDASPQGCQLPLDLRGPEWFPDPSVRIVDLGLRPATVRRLMLPWLPGTRLRSWPEALDHLLPDADLSWLVAGNVYELAAVPPARLMRAVYEGMAAAGRDDGSGRAPAYDGAHWAGVAGGSGSPAGGGGAELAAVDLAR